MSWKAEELPIVGNDPELWSVAEAGMILGLSHLQLTRLRTQIRFTHAFPVGRRRSAVAVFNPNPAPQGRMAKVYRAEELIELVEFLALGTRYTARPHPLDGTSRWRTTVVVLDADSFNRQGVGGSAVAGVKGSLDDTTGDA